MLNYSVAELRKKITLTYNGETIEVPMPQGEFCGRTVSYELP